MNTNKIFDEISKELKANKVPFKLIYELYKSEIDKFILEDKSAKFVRLALA